MTEAMSTTTNERARFNAWMRQVDAACIRIAGVSIHDLADQPFYDWFLDDLDPTDAAHEALEDEGFPY